MAFAGVHRKNFNGSETVTHQADKFRHQKIRQRGIEQHNLDAFLSVQGFQGRRAADRLMRVPLQRCQPAADLLTECRAGTDHEHLHGPVFGSTIQIGRRSIDDGNNEESPYT